MIEFNVLPYKNINTIPNKYPELIRYEVDFKILINKKLFFEEQSFPLLEFLYFANQWKKLGNGSFEYVSIETDDNPLISFICQDEACELFFIYSPWQLFECKTIFSKSELYNALEALNEMFF